MLRTMLMQILMLGRQLEENRKLVVQEKVETTDTAICPDNLMIAAFPKYNLSLCYTNTNMGFVFATHKLAFPKFYFVHHKPSP